MKVAILSTPTKHHTYFINRLADRFEIAGVLYETRTLTKPYPTGPFFAEEEDSFEDRFFDPAFGGTAPIVRADVAAKTKTFRSANDAEALNFLRGLDADVTVSFGTGKLNRPTFAAAPFGTVNVHRGVAATYRGLDSDLWAVLEGRFDQIGVTLHYVDDDLDTGAILAEGLTPIEAGDEIYHLRYKTSVLATDLMIDVLAAMEKAGGPIPGNPQKVAGPYYSAMSLDEKMRAGAMFRQYQEDLARG